MPTFYFPNSNYFQKSNKENIHSTKKKVRVTGSVRNGAHAKEGHDWLANAIMSTNEKQAKRKVECDGNYDYRTFEQRSSGQVNDHFHSLLMIYKLKCYIISLVINSSLYIEQG